MRLPANLPSKSPAICAAFSALALSLLAAPALRAETLVLVDGSKIAGEIVHSFRGAYTVKTAEGEIVLDRTKIKRIDFDAPPARAVYGSPEKTLTAWRTAAAEGNEGEMVEAYALMFQGMVAREMESMDFRERSRMATDVAATTFTVKDKKVEGTKAVLTVDQQKDGETRSGEIRFVLENGEWKMTP